MAHTPSSSPRPTLLAASTTASYSSRSPSSASAAPALSPAPASAADMVATNGDRNGGVSSHATPNLGGSINSGGVKAGGGAAGAGDFLDVRPGTKHPAPGDLQRKCSTGSAAIMDLYGNSSQLGNRSMQRDIMASRASVCPSAHSAPPTRGDSAGGGSPGADPRKSRKFLNHWKQAASLTKIGSREAE